MAQITALEELGQPLVPADGGDDGKASTPPETLSQIEGHQTRSVFAGSTTSELEILKCYTHARARAAHTSCSPSVLSFPEVHTHFIGPRHEGTIMFATKPAAGPNPLPQLSISLKTVVAPEVMLGRRAADWMTLTREVPRGQPQSRGAGNNGGPKRRGTMTSIISIPKRSSPP